MDWDSEVIRQRNILHTSHTSHTIPTPTDKNIDTLCDEFNKINIAGGTFSEVFYYFLNTQPNTIINFTPTSNIHFIEGLTRFNNKYEQDFITLVNRYNNIPKRKFTISYKKENYAFDYFYDCVYALRFQLIVC